MATPHNSAEMGDIAKTVLLPGDPLRAQFIAQTYLENVKCFSNVRNMLGFTGTYKGHKVSVMGSGMGTSSVGIYSYELYKFYGVENIIRIGSAGAYVPELDVFDVVVASEAYSESTYAKAFNDIDGNLAYPSLELNEKILETAKEQGIPIHLGTVHSSDVFYHEANSKYMDEVKKHNCIAVEMESFAMFTNAKVLGKRAACIITISDSLVTHKETTAEERQTSFDKMMKLALETSLKLD